MDNIHKSAIVKTGELDLMLARELELDARQSIRCLSKKLAVSEITIRKRIQELLDKEVITIHTFTTPRVLGFHAPVLIGLNVLSGKADEVAELLRSHKSISSITLTTGRYDILISTLLRNPLELTRFLYEDLGNIPYVVSTEKILFLDGIKQSWKYLNGDIERYQEPKPRDFDELDLKLIKELELCPRESIGNLGKKLGVNRNSISRKLKSLLDDHVIRVISLAEPSFFGLNVQASIFVKVQLSKVMSVANSLVAERMVNHILVTTGGFELFLSAAFRDLGEMSDFLRNQLGSYPGVISHETLIEIKSIKRSFSVLT